MTLKQRVEAYTGTVADATFQQYATDIVRVLVDLLPPPMARKLSTRSNFAAGGYSVNDGQRVVAVEVAGSPAVEIPVEWATKALSSSSLMFRTSLDPAFYIQDKTLYMTPIGTANVHTLTYETPAVDSEKISVLPDSLSTAVVVDVAKRVLLNSIQTLYTNIANLSLTLPTLSATPPVAPTYTWSNVTLGTLTPASIASAFPNPPAYSSGGIPSLTTEFAQVLTYLNTQEDIELGQAELSYIKGRLEEFQVKMQDAISNMNEENILFQSEIQRLTANMGAAQQAIMAVYEATKDVALQNEIQTIQAAINTWRDSLALYGGLVQTHVSLVGIVVQEFGTLLTRELGKVDLVFKRVDSLSGEFTQILILAGILQNDSSNNGRNG